MSTSSWTGRRRSAWKSLWLQNRSYERTAGISRGDETLRFTDMVSSRRASSANVWLALGIVYVVLGSTYLAIAIAVQTLPPLFYSGVRFAAPRLILAGRLPVRAFDLHL